MFAIVHILFLFLLIQCNGETYRSKKKDIKYAKCSICREAMKVLTRNISARRKKKKDGVLSEEIFLDHMVKMCNPDTEEGEWIRKIDLVPGKGRLVVRQQENFGKCKSECQTIAEVCSKIMDKHDVVISEMLWKRNKRSKITRRICRQSSKYCRKKKLNALRETDEYLSLGTEEFEVLTAEEWEAEKITRSLKNVQENARYRSKKRKKRKERKKRKKKKKKKKRKKKKKKKKRKSFIKKWKKKLKKKFFKIRWVKKLLKADWFTHTQSSLDWNYKFWKSRFYDTKNYARAILTSEKARKRSKRQLRRSFKIYRRKFRRNYKKIRRTLRKAGIIGKKKKKRKKKRKKKKEL